MRAAPACTVVVPVRDDHEALATLVQALADQALERSRFDVVVADDGSRAGPPTHLEDPPWLRVSGGPAGGSFAARNRGARIAQGRVLAFTDADCRPDPDWLERGLAALESLDFAAGRVEPVLPAEPTPWSLVDLGTWRDLEQLVLRGGALTANLIVRRDAFDRVGGFDERLASGGDFDFAERCLHAGLRGGFAWDAVVRHATIDRGGPLLHKYWDRHRWAGIREARAGRAPPRVRPRYWVPGMNLVRRRNQGLPLTLGEAGAHAGVHRRLAAYALRDGPLHYLACTAQLVGWLGERRRVN